MFMSCYFLSLFFLGNIYFMLEKCFSKNIFIIEINKKRLIFELLVCYKN